MKCLEGLSKQMTQDGKLESQVGKAFIVAHNAHDKGKLEAQVGKAFTTTYNAHNKEKLEAKLLNFFFSCK